MFESKGLFLDSRRAPSSEDQLMELALEAGAEDVHATDDGKFEVICDPTLFHQVEKALSHAEIKPEASQLTRIAKNMVDIQSPKRPKKSSSSWNASTTTTTCKTSPRTSIFRRP